MIADAMGATVTALVAVIAELQTQIARLEAELADRFEQHPDAKIIRSLPGLGMTLGARGMSRAAGAVSDVRSKRVRAEPEVATPCSSIRFA